jgi:hypothetical protein
VKEVNVSPLAESTYEILRLRAAEAEPRISYAELARRLREVSGEFETITHRSRELYAALGEVGRECRRLKKPPLPALVVRADTRRPGAAYFEGRCSGRTGPAGREVAAWWEDLEAVRRTAYPARQRGA